MRHRGFRRALPPLTTTLLALACEGPPPDQVRVELPELVTAADPVRATVYVRRNGASTVTNDKVSFTVTPPDVASFDKTTNLTCNKSGDATVTASVQGVKNSASIKCRLVDRLEAVSLPVLDVNAPPVTLNVHGLGKSGTPLDDVPVTVTTDNPRTLSVTGTTLTPLAVGETHVTLSAGTKSARLPARVVRSLKPEALPLEGGHRIYFGLPDGKYEVDIELPVEKDVSVEWRGAPYCAYKGHGRSHVSTCVLEHKGGAVVDNPAYLLTGSSDPSTTGISVREVP
jgi:hypothetical protein